MMHGYRTNLWTTARIAELIAREFGIQYHRDHVGRLLHSLNWSPQKPEWRALERNDEAIEHWKQKHWRNSDWRGLVNSFGREPIKIESSHAPDVGRILRLAKSTFSSRQSRVVAVVYSSTPKCNTTATHSVQKQRGVGIGVFPHDQVAGGRVRP